MSKFLLNIYTLISLILLLNHPPFLHTLISFNDIVLLLLLFHTHPKISPSIMALHPVVKNNFLILNIWISCYHFAQQFFSLFIIKPDGQLIYAHFKFKLLLSFSFVSLPFPLAPLKSSGVYGN